MNMSETERLRKEAEQSYKRITELEAENERLKCCVSCTWWQPLFYDCGAYDEGAPVPDFAPRDHCHFTPSRWTERITP